MRRAVLAVKTHHHDRSVCAGLQLLSSFEHSARSSRRCLPVSVVHAANTTAVQSPVVHGKRKRRDSICTAAAAVTALGAVQQQEETAVDLEHSDDLDLQRAAELLYALSRYKPTGLADGPASLMQVKPYNAAAVQHALDHGTELLASLSVRQLSNMAAALAAAGHVDSSFMQRLGHTAAQQLQGAPAPDHHVAALAELKTICFLAVACARMGLLHVELLECLAVRGASLLSRPKILYPRKRSHGQHLALLAAAFAALKLYPPQLFRALGELFKQQKHVLWLLGPQESMLLLWAIAEVQHKDPPAQLLLTQRATTQVGQLDCQGLAHAYTQCASGRLTAPPLLSALRKATRQRLRGMQPQHLTAILVALAGLGQQNPLLLDELSGALHNKMANMTAAQISTCFTACSILRYRNPWLFEQASKMLVSRKLAKAVQFTASQLADIMLACKQLRYHNGLLFAHLGSVAAESLCISWTAAELAAVLQGYCATGFYQPQLLLAMARQLVGKCDTRRQQIRQQEGGATQQLQQLQHHGDEAGDLISAAYWLAHMPAAGGLANERSLTRQAVFAVAAVVLQDQQAQQGYSLSHWAEIGAALLLSTAGSGLPQSELQLQRQENEVLQAVLQHVVEQVTPVAAADELAAVGPHLLQLIQLLWLLDVQLTDSASQQQQQQPWHKHQMMWQQTLEQPASKQLHDSPLLRAVLPLVQQHCWGPYGAQVVSCYVLPGSPITLPAAVIFPGTTADGDVAKGFAEETEARSASQLLQRTQQEFVVAEVHVGPRRLTLPAELLQLLQRCKAECRPVAIFDESQPLPAQGTAVSCAHGWFTSSEPRLLLPSNAVWRDGLVTAGWSIVILVQMAADQDADQS